MKVPANKSAAADGYRRALSRGDMRNQDRERKAVVSASQEPDRESRFINRRIGMWRQHSFAELRTVPCRASWPYVRVPLDLLGL